MPEQWEEWPVHHSYCGYCGCVGGPYFDPQEALERAREHRRNVHGGGKGGRWYQPPRQLTQVGLRSCDQRIRGVFND
jgi:hypothetical protein